MSKASGDSPHEKAKEVVSIVILAAVIGNDLNEKHLPVWATAGIVVFAVSIALYYVYLDTLGVKPVRPDSEEMGAAASHAQGYGPWAPMKLGIGDSIRLGIATAANPASAAREVVAHYGLSQAVKHSLRATVFTFGIVLLGNWAAMNDYAAVKVMASTLRVTIYYFEMLAVGLAIFAVTRLFNRAVVPAGQFARFFLIAVAPIAIAISGVIDTLVPGIYEAAQGTGARGGMALAFVVGIWLWQNHICARVFAVAAGSAYVSMFVMVTLTTLWAGYATKQLGFEAKIFEYFDGVVDAAFPLPAASPGEVRPPARQPATVPAAKGPGPIRMNGQKAPARAAKARPAKSSSSSDEK